MNRFPATRVTPMQRSIPFCLALLAAVSLAGAIPLAKADIIPIGDVSPSNPSAWTTSTTGYIGKTATGTLTVNDGGYLRSYYGYIGYGSTATGVVTVDGTRSTWDNRIAWYVGYSGSGTLSITNGGNVSSTNAAQCGALIGYNSGSKGVVTVDGPGSTWSNGSVCIGRSGSGVLSITNGGSVVTGVYSTGGDIGCNPGSAGVVIVDGADSTWTNGRQLYVGDQGSGMLLVTNGGSVNCGNVSGNLYVGNGGGGTVSITNGGSFSSYQDSYIGYSSGSTGMARVDDSLWTSSSLYVGNSGSGTFSITGGGTVYIGNSVSINSASLLAIDIGAGSLLWADTITNKGIIRILAGAGAVANAKGSPITAETWSGAGMVQAIGGTWSSTGHTFTASSVIHGTSGSAVSLNLASVQRTLVGDNGPGGANWEVGASFLAAASTRNITFSAMAMTPPTLSTLISQLPTNESILSGWTFSTTNYAVSSTNPLYLSFNVGAGHPADELDLWQYTGTTWTPFVPTDLTYDGTFASFTATGLSGYAVAAVPEPGTLVLLAAGLVGLLSYSRCRRRAAIRQPLQGVCAL